MVFLQLTKTAIKKPFGSYSKKESTTPVLINVQNIAIIESNETGTIITVINQANEFDKLYCNEPYIEVAWTLSKIQNCTVINSKGEKIGTSRQI